MAELTLLPKDLSLLWIPPDTNSTLIWTLANAPASTPPAAKSLGYVVRNYQDQTAATGQASINEAGELTVSLSLPVGYYSIEFTTLKQTFGVVSLNAHQGPKDPFFCIDTAMSWLLGKTSTAPSRESMIKVLSRIGVAMARERLGWGDGMQPSLDTWNWQAENDYDSIRQCYAQNGVEVLEMFHTSPEHIGKAIGYNQYRLPLNMIKTEASWSAIAKHWQNTWGALEIWNELDGGFFCGNAPAEQYAPLVKTIAYTFTRDGVKTPLVGGVVAYGWDEGFLELAAKNGVLKNIDAWSVHTYGHNSSLVLENFMRVYREAFKKYGVEAMPVWDTESGFAWTAKTSRPPVNQGAASALELIMKAVEANACGMERYFPFVYPYYAEEICNYSMTDKLGTPLRSIAAYAWAIEVLGNRQYIGDWRCNDPAIKRARVFADKDTAVLVVFTGNILPIANVSDVVTKEPATIAKVTLPKEAQLRGIDGRALPRGKGKIVNVPDGMIYVVMPRDIAQPYVKTDTIAQKLYTIAHGEKIHRGVPSPILLQFRPDEHKYYEANIKDYVPTADAPNELTIPVDVVNLSDAPIQVNVQLRSGEGPIGESKDVTVEGQKIVRVEWKLPWDEVARFNPIARDFTVTATKADGSQADSIFFRLKGRPTLESWLKLFRTRKKIPVEQLSRWSPSAIRGARSSMSMPEEAVWRLDVDFNGATDRWAYPRYRLPEELDLSKYKGIVFEGRCESGALAVRAVLWETQSDGQEITFMTNNILASDNQWHPVFVPFTHSKFGASGVDPNNKINLHRVRNMSFGMNSGADKNALLIRNVWLVGGE